MIFPHMTFHCKLVLTQMSRNITNMSSWSTNSNQDTYTSYYKLNTVHYFIYYKIQFPLSLSLLIRIHFRQKSMRLCILFNHNNIILSKYQPIEIIISCNVHSTLKTNFSNYGWKFSERKRNFLNNKLINIVIHAWNYRWHGQSSIFNNNHPKAFIFSHLNF